MESWSELYAKARAMQKFRNMGEDGTFEKLWILKGKW